MKREEGTEPVLSKHWMSTGVGEKTGVPGM